MSCFPCCNKSDVESSSYRASSRKISKGRRTFKSLAAAMSLKSGSSRHRQINAELLKYGAAKNDVKIFTYEELAEATKNFSPDCLVGEGGFGNVYKGYIKSIEQTVAVKQLNREGAQGTREFFAEVLMLSMVKHPNLAQPLFKDRTKFALMADPLLKGQFPVKGLFQALAVAAMCLQEEADTRPFMDDVVTALQHLAVRKVEEKDIAGESVKIAGHVESFRAMSSMGSERA
ncbi:Protein kinase domain [Sesbania bispinosa]|nr:Protein kinase domain [Sesbania bispinosa]